MSESKKVLYNRKTASNALMELSNRLTEMDFNDYDIPVDIKDVIIFGSYVKGVKKVHDLDVFVAVTEHREKYEDFWNDRKGTFYDPMKGIEFALTECGKYLKGKNRVISLHMDAYAFEEELKIATSDTHYYLMKDGKVDYDVVDHLLMMDVDDQLIWQEINDVVLY